MANTTQAISKIGQVPAYKAGEIRALMERLNMSEKGFAFLMNVAPTTVRLWTTGASEPCNPSRRLMQILDEVPQVIELLAEETVEN